MRDYRASRQGTKQRDHHLSLGQIVQQHGEKDQREPQLIEQRQGGEDFGGGELVPQQSVCSQGHHSHHRRSAWGGGGGVIGVDKGSSGLMRVNKGLV